MSDILEYLECMPILDSGFAKGQINICVYMCVYMHIERLFLNEENDTFFFFSL